MKTTRKPLFILALAASLLLNAFFVLRNIPIRSGGGSFKPSPDETLVGYANSLTNDNPFAPDHNITTGELEIRTSGGDRVISLNVVPPGIDDSMGYRTLNDPVSWSQDSATVTFDLPHATITITPKTLTAGETSNSDSQSSNIDLPQGPTGTPSL